MRILSIAQSFSFMTHSMHCPLPLLRADGGRPMRYNSQHLRTMTAAAMSANMGGWSVFRKRVGGLCGVGSFEKVVGTVSAHASDPSFCHFAFNPASFHGRQGETSICVFGDKIKVQEAIGI
jgi:hypothetical protein